MKLVSMYTVDFIILESLSLNRFAVIFHIGIRSVKLLLNCERDSYSRHHSAVSADVVEAASLLGQIVRILKTVSDI